MCTQELIQHFPINIISEVVILKHWNQTNDILLKKKKSLKAEKQLKSCLKKESHFLFFLLEYCGIYMIKIAARCKQVLR